MTFAQKSTRQIIKSFEAKALKKRTISIRIADALTSYAGTLSFFIVNLVIFIAWIVINLGYATPYILPFDPFPFILLTTAVSLEAIVLSVIVLISQNRQSYISSVRDELILQTNIIADKELTKLLKLVNDIHDHHGIKSEADPELEAMLKATNISYIERKLEEELEPTTKNIPQLVTSPLVNLSQRVTSAIKPFTIYGDDKNTKGDQTFMKRIRVGTGKAK